MIEETGSILMPRRSANKIQINAYDGDYKNFKKFIESLNSEINEGEYTEEDVFSFMLSKALESFPKQKSKVLGKSKKGRSSKKEEVPN